MFLRKFLVVIIIGILFIASAVASEAAILYGTETFSGHIYKIDTDTQTSSFVFATNVSPTTGFSPNGNGYDAVNNRFYYVAVKPPPTDFFFYDGIGQVSAGWLDGKNAGGDFYNGRYYYIENGNDDLRVVGVDAAGIKVSEASVVPGGITGGAKSFGFGDIAIRSDGILFGSATEIGTGTTEFFSVDLITRNYTVISNLQMLQIAFGSDGNLYGHATAYGDFFIIDTTNGTANYIFTDRTFTDLATVPAEDCPVCGDGNLDPGEQCDDGNNIDGDGCSAICTLEYGLEGCTPGYWKQEQHFDSWTAPYMPSTPFSNVFEDAFSGMTLLEVLKQGGGNLNALGRHTVAALLNAASLGVNYNLTTTAVITMFNDVFLLGGDYEYELLKVIFQSFNEQGCPLNSTNRGAL